jgi:hypothetical protein
MSTVKKWFGWVGFRVWWVGSTEIQKSVFRREFRDSTPVTSVLGSWAEPRDVCPAKAELKQTQKKKVLG